VVHVRVVSNDVPFARSLARALTAGELTTERSTLGGVYSEPGDGIDVVVLDIHPTGPPDGDDVVGLRTHIRGPVIVLTPDAKEISLIPPLAAGARGVVLRSSGARVVQSAVRAVCDGGLFLDPAVAGTLARLVALTARSDGGAGLTRTELRVLQRFPSGLSNAQIAADMGLSVNTIKTHVRHILTKLECDNRVQAVQVAMTRGLLL
jgi:DNA-binding NarL/FixJ family response regulator